MVQISSVSHILTLQSPDGDIIDCVNIVHQPAFDHPFLRNHTVQVFIIPPLFPLRIFLEALLVYFCSNLVLSLLHLFLASRLFQLRPAFHPEGLFEDNKLASELSKEKPNALTQLWHQNGRCPEGTIPVRRTRREEVLRASSVKRYGRKKHRTIPRPRSADPDLINESGHQVKLWNLLK